MKKKKDFDFKLSYYVGISLLDSDNLNSYYTQIENFNFNEKALYERT